MANSYYPWNVQSLLNWLKLEQVRYGSLQALAQELGIQTYIIRAWRIEPMPEITLKHVQKIAQLRGWDITKTAEWLNLKQAHLDALASESKASASESKASVSQPVAVSA